MCVHVNNKFDVLLDISRYPYLYIDYDVHVT